MELSMSERRAVTKTIATRYARSDRAGKKVILDELCATMGWHRDHARKALRSALVLRPVTSSRKPRAPLYGEPVIEALRFLWAVQGTPCGRLLAASLPDLVPRLRRLGELDVDDATAVLLLQIAPATIDRRLKADRARLDPRGRSHTKPGTLLKDSIPMRTWAEWDDAVPGFVEIDLVGHEGGNNRGDYCFTLDITDIATGWTDPVGEEQGPEVGLRRDQGRHRVLPVPDQRDRQRHGSEFINWELFRWCQAENLTFTRSRSGNKNDGSHVEQKNWHIVRQSVGYHRYDTPAELDLLNRIWELQRLMTNHFAPQQKLVSKTRIGAKTTKKYDLPAAPYTRVLADTGIVRKAVKTRLAKENQPLNPAAIQRQIQALAADLLTLTTAKRGPKPAPSPRASSGDSSKPAIRAS
jgi:hypothetical protein